MSLRNIIIYNCTNRPLILDKFIDSASALMKYMSLANVKEEYTETIIPYRRYLLSFIYKVLDKEGHKNLEIHNFKRLQLSTINTENIEKYYISLNLPKPQSVRLSKDGWGPVYWQFLHSASILVQGSDLVDYFGLLLLNFNAIIYCGECYVNFAKHDPLNSITLKMRQSRDSVRTVFDLHNVVNQSINKPLYSFEVFKNQNYLVPNLLF